MKYGLIGATGKMGKAIAEAFEGHELCLAVDSKGEYLDGLPEVIVDFSRPSALPRTIELCRRHHAGLVIGTSGLTEQDLHTLGELGGELPVIQSYNFSVGVAALSMILKEFAPLFENWDSEMVEIHHNQKVDAPSGTALLLKKSLDRDIKISSLRIGGVPGDHSVLFANNGEVVTFTHRAISRKVFALGALKAAIFAISKESGFYSFEEVIKCELKK